MPKFVKTIEELETDLDKWMFVFKNIDKLNNIPPRLQNKIFMKFFGEAEIANMGKGDRTAYEESLKVYRDNKNVMDTARGEGYNAGYHEAEEKLMLELDTERRQKEEAFLQKEEERRQKEEERRQKEELIKFLSLNGTSIAQISEIVHMSEVEIQAIIRK